MKHLMWLDRYNRMPKHGKAAIWFFVCSLMQKGISILCTPIFTRLLTTDEYGRYNEFDSWLAIATIFVTFRLYYGSYTQGLVKYEDDRNSYSASMAGLVTSMCFIWLVVYICFHDYINTIFKLSFSQVLSMIALIWSTAIFQLWAAEQRVLLKYKSLVALTLIVSFAKPIVGVIFIIASEDKVSARIYALALVEIIGFSWLFFLMILRGRLFFHLFYWKRAIILNSPLILHYLSQTVLNSSDRIMIARLVGNKETGVYSLAYQIALGMTLFSNTLTQTLTPWIYQKIKTNKLGDIRKIMRVSLLFMAIVILLLIVAVPEVVSLFAPDSYSQAVWIIPPIAISTYFMFCYDLFAKFEFYFERTNYIAAASILGAVLNVGLNLLCIPFFGYFAAAYTTLICYAFYAMAHYVAMSRICKKEFPKIRILDTNKLLLFSLFLVMLALLLMITYKSDYLRYGLLVFIFVSIVMNKRLIVKSYNLLNVKDDK